MGGDRIHDDSLKIGHLPSSLSLSPAPPAGVEPAVILYRRRWANPPCGMIVMSGLLYFEPFLALGVRSHYSFVFACLLSVCRVLKTIPGFYCCCGASVKSRTCVQSGGLLHCRITRSPLEGVLV